MYELMIQNQGVIYLPLVEDGVSWETERKGSSGKLTFAVVKDAGLNFQEGNPVRFRADGKDVFYGFVFSKQRTKDGLIHVTAYDQLRYLKNKDTIRDVGKKASALLQKIAADFRKRWRNMWRFSAVRHGFSFIGKDTRKKRYTMISILNW